MKQARHQEIITEQQATEEKASNQSKGTSY